MVVKSPIAAKKSLTGLQAVWGKAATGLKEVEENENYSIDDFRRLWYK